MATREWQVGSKHQRNEVDADPVLNGAINCRREPAKE